MIDNPKILIAEDDMALVSGLTNYLKLKNWSHITVLSNVFSNNEKSEKWYFQTLRW